MNSTSTEQCLPVNSSSKENGDYKYYSSNNTNPMYKFISYDESDMKTIQEAAHHIRDALSSIVRTRCISVDVQYQPSMCQTCITWSVFDLGLEYGPFTVQSTIPKMLQPLIL